MSSETRERRSWMSGSSALADSLSPEALIGDWISKHLTKPTPDEVVIAGTGIPVWAIIAYAHALDADLERVASDYDIPAAAVSLQRFSTTSQYSEFIESRLLANEIGVE